MYSLLHQGCCYTGYSYSNNNSPFYMGIPRLKFPADAPSRSTLKLEEAFHVFIPADEWDERPANGMWAVDLGACPGRLDLPTGEAQHVGLFRRQRPDGAKSDGYRTGDVAAGRRFQIPSDTQQYLWMVCDMVEKTGESCGIDGAVAG